MQFQFVLVSWMFMVVSYFMLVEYNKARSSVQREHTLQLQANNEHSGLVNIALKDIYEQKRVLEAFIDKLGDDERTQIKKNDHKQNIRVIAANKTIAFHFVHNNETVWILGKRRHRENE